ncbi:hypothetical protein ACOSP7_018488 [Xanthoceras sorbifolium]
MDFGKEFPVLSPYLQKCGILFRHSYLYTHEQNGLVERMHRHLMETNLSLLAHASLPLKYWDEVFLTSVYLINRMPTPILSGKASYVVLFGSESDYLFLKVFGCLVYPYLRPYNKTKLQFMSSPCTILGYSPKFKGYKCLYNSGLLYIVRHAVFYEHLFPFTVLDSQSNSFMASIPVVGLFPPVLPTYRSLLPVPSSSVSAATSFLGTSASVSVVGILSVSLASVLTYVSSSAT